MRVGQNTITTTVSGEEGTITVRSNPQTGSVSIVEPDPFVIEKSVFNDDQRLVSPVFNVLIDDGSTTQLSRDIEICIEVERGVEEDEVCLGFIDESVDPPEWKCEDECPEKKGSQICGKTGHATNFGVLLGGAGGGDSCGSSYLYFTGDATWDSITILLCILLMICIVIAVILVSMTAAGDRVVYGRERRNIHKIRRKGIQSVRITAVDASPGSNFYNT